MCFDNIVTNDEKCIKLIVKVSGVFRFFFYFLFRENRSLV